MNNKNQKKQPIKNVESHQRHVQKPVQSEFLLERRTPKNISNPPGGHPGNQQSVDQNEISKTVDESKKEPQKQPTKTKIQLINPSYRIEKKRK